MLLMVVATRWRTPWRAWWNLLRRRCSLPLRCIAVREGRGIAVCVHRAGIVHAAAFTSAGSILTPALC